MLKLGLKTQSPRRKEHNVCYCKGCRKGITEGEFIWGDGNCAVCVKELLGEEKNEALGPKKLHPKMKCCPLCRSKQGVKVTYLSPQLECSPIRLYFKQSFKGRVIITVGPSLFVETIGIRCLNCTGRLDYLEPKFLFNLFGKKFWITRWVKGITCK